MPRMLSTISITLLGALLLVSCSGVSTSPVSTVSPASDPPTVSMVVPQTSGVGTNREIAVVFNKAMDPASINTSTFVVAGVTGIVTYDAANKIGSFKASADYVANTMYSAHITTGAKDMNGTPLAAPFDFSFTTRATIDASPPDVFAINVAAGATGIPLNQKIIVTFDEQMDSLTTNSGTVFIVGVAGTVTYDVVSQSATFTPTANLTVNTKYTIMVTTAVKDMGGVPMAAAYSLTFTTGTSNTGMQIVALCPFIGGFSVLAGSAVTNTGSTTVSGDVGISPGTAATGFSPGLTSGTIHIADGAAAQA